MSEKKKKQTMRYSIDEMGIAKNTFAENEDLFFALRKVFLQMPLDEVDKQSLKAHIVGKPDVLKLIRKTYLPELDPAAPIHQIIDLWMTVELKEKSPEDAYPHILSRELLIKYLAQQLEVLESLEDNGSIRLSDMATVEGKNELDLYVGMVTRNMLIAHNEQQLNQLNTLAGTKTETPEETVERLKKDSSK
jgi:hypothetical protein